MRGENISIERTRNISEEVSLEERAKPEKGEDRKPLSCQEMGVDPEAWRKSLLAQVLAKI
ncbi:MAG: hypothetical protein ABIB61_00075 [Candidatus Shapirobacteria bacterium]